MKDLYLSVDNWAAWISPGRAKDLAGSGPADRVNTLEPEIGFVSANHRRRLTPLSRIVVDTYHRANGNPDGVLQIPSIFCSTFGEHERNTRLILDISKDSDVSPTAFSLSVHNALAGLVSIFYGNEAPCITMATNRSGISMALIEAYSMLGETSPISLTIYDGPVHESYQDIVINSDETAAITMIVSPERRDKDRLHAEQTTGNGYTQSPQLEIIEIVNLLLGRESGAPSDRTVTERNGRVTLGDWSWCFLQKECEL